MLFRDRREQILESADRLAVSEKQVARLVQAVMHERQDPPLHINIQINEEVATTNEVQPVEGRVSRQIVPDEHAQIADLLLDSITSLDSFEVAREPPRVHTLQVGLGIETGPRRLDRSITQVRREDLDGQLSLLLGQRL